MSRNRFLVTYDITADRRRDRVFKALKDVGDHLSGDTLPGVARRL